MNSQPGSYYAVPPNRQRPLAAARKRRWPLVLLIVLLLAGGGVSYGLVHKKTAPKPVATQTAVQRKASAKKQPATTASAATPQSTACTSNADGQLILVSVSKRHLWACDGSKQLYDSAVVTGMEMYPADLTPPGTYHIYAKYVNTVLKGSDGTGSWNDPVDYWMPWLHNEYGTYGFHDAQWRAPNDFGNISPNSTQASHGCVELPLPTAKWLYNWAQIGTTVTVEA